MSKKIRIEITADDYAALKRLASRLDQSDMDCQVLCRIVEDKERKILEHNLKTIAFTSKDKDTCKVANDMYNSSRRTRF